VEISKRIEEAEKYGAKAHQPFRLHPRAPISILPKKTDRRRGSDSTVSFSTKKIESRERYMKILAAICASRFEKLGDTITQNYAKLSSNSSKKGHQGIESVFSERSLLSSGFYPKFYFKQKVTEEFVPPGGRALSDAPEMFRLKWPKTSPLLWSALTSRDQIARAGEIRLAFS